MKKIIIKLIKSYLFNYKHPKYRKFIYDISRQYVNFYRNDQNSHMETNGEYRFLLNFFKNYHPKVFFDVGANQGDYVSFILKHVTNISECSIHCFEPDSFVFKKLLEVTTNNPINIQLNNVAVSDSVDIREIYINKEAPELNSFYDTQEEGFTISKVSVQTVTLDQYCDLHGVKIIDLLKVDVEGHELAVFKGANQLLQRHAIQFIQFEFGNAAIYSRTFFKDLYDLFVSKGYEVYKIMPLTLKKVEYGPDLEKITYANFLAVSKNVDVSSLL